jgi:hypothetical protein
MPFQTDRQRRLPFQADSHAAHDLIFMIDLLPGHELGTNASAWGTDEILMYIVH